MLKLRNFADQYYTFVELMPHMRRDFHIQESVAF